MVDDEVEHVLELLRELTGDAEFFQELGKLFRRHVSMATAKAAYDVSLRLDPCDPFTHLYVGNWHYQQGELGEAVECFEYAAGLRPDLAVCYWCLADMY